MARIGRQTPTQSAIIPYTASKGVEAAKLYALTGRELMEWQREVLKNMLAVTDEGLWTHIKFGYSVSRRNGKTEMVYAREMWGLLHGEKILHTAHRTDTAHSSWESLYELIKKTGIPIEHTFRANGREHIFITGGGRIEYRTRTSKVRLGQGYDFMRKCMSYLFCELYRLFRKNDAKQILPQFFAQKSQFFYECRKKCDKINEMYISLRQFHGKGGKG